MGSNSQRTSQQKQTWALASQTPPWAHAPFLNNEKYFTIWYFISPLRANSWLEKAYPPSVNPPWGRSGNLITCVHSTDPGSNPGEYPLHSPHGYGRYSETPHPPKSLALSELHAFLAMMYSMSFFHPALSEFSQHPSHTIDHLKTYGCSSGKEHLPSVQIVLGSPALINRTKLYQTPYHVFSPGDQ